MKNLEILVVSNGLFEDMMACQIIKNLKKIYPSIFFKALPLVGEGKAYIQENIEILGPCKNLPSEGLVHFGFKNFIKDIKEGLINLLIQQIKIIRKEGEKVDFIIAVGDIFLCFLCGFFSGKKVIFASTAQSIYIRKIDRLNIYLVKRYAKVVFPRDQATTKYMKKFDIPAIYFGSLAMDCIEISGKNFNIPEKSKVIGMLIGRRKDAFEKLKYLLEIVEEIEIELKKRNYEISIFFIISLPLFSINKEEFKKNIEILNWRFAEENKKEGIIGYLIKNSNKIIVTDEFGDVINKSNLVIGFSGAANEQAVGFGKPVITFPVKNNLYPWKFFKKEQKNLLGEAVFPLPYDKKIIVKKIFSILNNSKIEEKVKKIGLERVGPKGAGEKIASYIKATFIEPHISNKTFVNKNLFK